METARSGPARVAPYRLLDAFRGVAALWVVVFHAVQASPAGRLARLARHPLGAWTQYGRLGVVMFFVISGYCIASAAVSSLNKDGPLRSFAAARVRRIFPPYYAASAFVVAAALAASFLHARGLIGPSTLARVDPLHQRPAYYLAALTLTQIPLGQGLLVMVFWSLCYEIAFYGVVLLALAATPRRWGANALLLGLDALTMACLAWRAATARLLPFPFDLWPMFGLGVLLFHVRLAPAMRLPRALFGAAAVLAVVDGARHWDVGWFGATTPAIELGFALAFALLLYALRDLDDRASRWAPVRLLAWAGVFSYSLYLTHVPVQGLVAQLGRRLGASRAPSWVQEVVVILAAVAFARAFFAVFERPFLGARPAPRVITPDPPPAPAGPIGPGLPDAVA